MSATPRWRPALATQALLLQVAWVGVRVMLGYRALELGADAPFIAVLASAFAAPALVGSVLVGRLAGRVGGAVVVALGSVLVAVGCALPLSAPTQSWVLLVAAGIVGLGSVGVFVGQQTYVASRTRGRASDGDFGTLATAGSLGQLVGPPVVTGAAVLAATPRAPDTTIGLLVCSIAAACSVLPALLLRAADRSTASQAPEPVAPQGSLAVLRTPGLWRAILVSSAMLVTMDLLYTFLPAWAAERGIDAAVVGALLSLRALVSVASRLGLARLVARFGRKMLIVVSMALGVGALALLPMSDATAAIAVMVALGICLGLPQPLTLAWVVQITAERDHGAALGLRMAGNRLGQTAIPLAMTAVAGASGASGVIWGNAAVLAVATVLAALSSPGGPQPARLRR
ncbi:hypothetical protein GCM10009846_27680 [Agrococcus versicolor]|uniref:Major facilitator superfamily (MFS) profile domain-containing protein n=1 Tax=Agrococcus versicolor TaxID=501482 RepID=A0ABN3AWZ5_9MICO